MVFASSYVFDRLLSALEKEGAFGSLNVFEKLSRRYKEDTDLQGVYDTLRTYPKSEDPAVLRDVRSSLELLKDRRRMIESNYNGNIQNYDFWYVQNVLKISNKKYY